jgi:hypothetical protein
MVGFSFRIISERLHACRTEGTGARMPESLPTPEFDREPIRRKLATL